MDRQDAETQAAGDFEAAAKVAAMPKVYPAYIAFRCKDGLKAALTTKEFIEGPIVTAIGDLETTGDCRYAIPITDHNGTKYRVTVEVAK